MHPSHAYPFIPIIILILLSLFFLSFTVFSLSQLPLHSLLLSHSAMHPSYQQRQVILFTHQCIWFLHIPSPLSSYSYSSLCSLCIFLFLPLSCLSQPHVILSSSHLHYQSSNNDTQQFLFISLHPYVLYHSLSYPLSVVSFIPSFFLCRLKFSLLSLFFVTIIHSIYFIHYNRRSIIISSYSTHEYYMLICLLLCFLSRDQRLHLRVALLALTQWFWYEKQSYI